MKYGAESVFPRSEDARASSACMTFTTGSLNVFGDGLSAGAAEELSPAAEARGRLASCAASAQHPAMRKSCLARTSELPRLADNSEIFMWLELLRQISLSCEGQFSSMPERPASRKLGLSEAFTRKQPGSMQELRRGNLFASLQFDGADEQRRCSTATHQQLISFRSQGAGNQVFVELPGVSG